MWEVLVDCFELASVMILEADPLTEVYHALLHLLGELCILVFRHRDDKFLKLNAKSVSPLRFLPKLFLRTSIFLSFSPTPLMFFTASSNAGYNSVQYFNT